ncbi:hypothetical protein ACLOJK_033965 [Asimina triloba]
MAKVSSVVIEILSSDDDETPPRAKACRRTGTIGAGKSAKRRRDRDCCILDFDPFEPIGASKKLAVADGSEELSIVSERGPFDLEDPAVGAVADLGFCSCREVEV